MPHDRRGNSRESAASTTLREYEDFYNTHRPHRGLNHAAPLRPLPVGVTDLDHFRVRRRDHAGGVITNIAWWQQHRRHRQPSAGSRACLPYQPSHSGGARRHGA